MFTSYYLLILLGVIVYYFIMAFTYVINGKFNIILWYQKNILRLAWTIGLVHLVCLAYYIDGEMTNNVIEKALSFFSLPITFNPLFLGIALSAGFKRIYKYFVSLEDRISSSRKTSYK